MTGGILVLSCHKTSELRHAIIGHFSRENQTIREGIPVPDSLRKEATSLGVCTFVECLKYHRVLISAAPNLGNKVICRYPVFLPFRPLYNKMSLLCFLHF